jgi:hypothetical protein
MKRVVAGCIVACSLSTFGNAANFSRTANSGVATIVHLYDDWDPTTCRSAGGVVKLVNKPQHGKLTTGYVYRDYPYEWIHRPGFCVCGHAHQVVSHHLQVSAEISGPR